MPLTVIPARAVTHHNRFHPLYLLYSAKNPAIPRLTRPYYTMASMEEVHDFLSKIPGLVESVSMEKAMAFIRLAARLKDEIILALKST
ncbi:hypothetical protein K438DRAFT_869486 [Mycena galopus ATCC 62051]|nr:hypothetical protein K438DRAFT_869486 [Mycena galopus ATCC 62051]